MSFQITTPSKTFLLGEYVALIGGPAIILTTEPRFELIATTSHTPDVEGIHEKSPAGKWIQQNSDCYQPYHIQFIDPYRGLGGFGASSAQFVMLVALKNHLQSSPLNDFDLLNDYEKFAWNGEGIAPSGADLIAQLHGEICFFHKSKKEIKTFSWPFKDIGYCLIHTGNKLATHIHLKQLTNFNGAELERITFSGLASMEKNDSESFIKAIGNYAITLQLQGLIAEQTQDILKQLACCPEILIAKGCGALGADVILTIFNRQKQNEVVLWLKEKNFNVIVYGYEVAKGLSINVH
jgi:mevalonate kinase